MELPFVPKVSSLLGYLPTLHGEHGVDATLHNLAKNQSAVHEVFCNPPSASWARFEILRPQTSEIYLWDHMPRVPPQARRPDSVLQFIEGKSIHFLLVESKQDLSAFNPRMGQLLRQYFTGSEGYLGLLNRPAWHRRNLECEEWTVIAPDADEEIRYWLKRYPRSLVQFWTAFAFALSPEYDHDASRDPLSRELSNNIAQVLLEQHIDVMVAVRWVGPHHYPQVFPFYSERFLQSPFSSQLDRLLDPAKPQ